MCLGQNQVDPLTLEFSKQNVLNLTCFGSAHIHEGDSLMEGWQWCMCGLSKLPVCSMEHTSRADSAAGKVANKRS